MVALGLPQMVLTYGCVLISLGRGKGFAGTRKRVSIIYPPVKILYIIMLARIVCTRISIPGARLLILSYNLRRLRVFFGRRRLIYVYSKSGLAHTTLYNVHYLMSILPLYGPSNPYRKSGKVYITQAVWDFEAIETAKPPRNLCVIPTD